jgi:hypothetical protein
MSQNGSAAFSKVRRLSDFLYVTMGYRSKWFAGVRRRPDTIDGIHDGTCAATLKSLEKYRQAV